MDHAPAIPDSVELIAVELVTKMQLETLAATMTKNHGVCTNGTCTCLQYEWKGEWCEIEVHETDIGKVTSSNNPLGVVVLSVVCVGALFAIAGFTYNYMTKGKRGLNAVPGMDAMRSAVKGDDYEAAPENRYASNY